MPKLTLTDLTSLTNQTSAISTINANNALIEALAELLVSRDGTAPNTMTADLDINSKKLLNVASGTAAADGVNYAQLTAATGQVPGNSMLWETATADSDQGAGKVWGNAATASITILYVDDADVPGADISTWVQTWDNSTNSSSRGYITVVQKADGDNYAIFEVDGAVTDASGYTKIPVNYIVGDGTLADADPVSMHFTRSGDRGSTGIQMLFETATTDTDQGAGKLWLNNGTVASATVLYIDDVDNAAGTSINSQVDTWDDSTNIANRGSITFKKAGDPSIFATFIVSGVVTSASTYSKIAVTHVTSSGSFSDGDAIDVMFTRTGDVYESPTLPFTFDTSTTMADPGTGDFRLNNATVASVTAIAFDATTSGTGNPDVSDFIATWDDSTSTVAGHLTVIQEDDPAVWAVFSVSSVTDNTGWLQVTVSHVDSVGTFSSTDVGRWIFTRTGDKGDTGSTGSTGAPGATGSVGGGIPMAWESTTTDTDQGAGKVWLNHGTASSATVFYIDDVEDGGANINTLVDSWDDSTHSAIKGTLKISKNSDVSNFHIYNISGTVVSASTYSKIGVTHVVSNGTISDADEVSVFFTRSGDDGSGALDNIVEDTTPQLGGFLDANSKFISHAQGANIASVAGDTNIWTNFDGNTVHITGTNAITDFGTPKSAGDSMWVIFDAAASVVDSATITVAGNTNYQAAANDLALVYALTTSTFLFMPFPNSGASPVAAAGGGGWLGEGASGTAVGNSGDIIRVNQQTLDTNQSMTGTDNGSCTGPFAIASGVTLTLASGATFKVL